MAESITINRSKKNPNLIELKMTVTLGKVLSIANALEQYKNQSPVGQDTLDMIQGAAQKGQINL